MSPTESIEQRLGLAIVQHLKLQFAKGGLDEEASEGLEVAIDCLEKVYGDTECLDDLLGIFRNATQKKSLENKSQAVLRKNEGNDYMKLEQYERAVNSYTSAIELDPQSAVYYCNRAAAHTSMASYKKAISDCEEALKIDPNYGKAYGRMGLACMSEHDYKRAKESYEKALSIEPNNASYQQNLERVKEAATQHNQHATSTPSAAAPTAGMPNMAGFDFGALLNNPAVMNMASSLFQNRAVQDMFSGMAQPTNASEAPAAPPTDPATAAAGNQPSAAGAGPGAAGGPPGAAGGPPGGAAFDPMSMLQGMDLSQIMNATQGFAQQMQQTNPELCENLRQQFQGGGSAPPGADPNNDNSNNPS